MPTVAQCFSALVASGNGQRCNSLRLEMSSALSEKDEETGVNKAYLYKYLKDEYPEKHKELRKQVAQLMNWTFRDIDSFYFGNDLSKENSDGSAK